MTVRKTARCGGRASVVARVKLRDANDQINITSVVRAAQPCKHDTIVNFNEKDQLCLADEDKLTTEHCIAIDDITSCVNVENLPHCANTLVFYVTESASSEAIVVRFENEQDFKRIYFTYKYFKMRNRLAKQTVDYAAELFPKKACDVKNAKGSTCDDSSLGKNEVSHPPLRPKGLKSYFDQPMSLIGITNEAVRAELTPATETSLAVKTEKKKLFHRKPKAPLPPAPRSKDSVNKEKVLKGDYVRVSVEKPPDVIPKENRVSRTPDILMFRENKPKRSSPPSLWMSNKGPAGYESDCEEWRGSRSQFSTADFDSLTRPSQMALALTLRKPRLDPLHQYYRPNDVTMVNVTQNQYTMKPPRLCMVQEKRNLVLDHRKFQSLQSLDLRKPVETKKQEVRRSNYSNFSHKINGLTSKLRDLGGGGNTLGRYKAHSHGDVSTLKPVLKCHSDGSKRSVVRTCSVEPPKKVTFSAFATVQVV